MGVVYEARSPDQRRVAIKLTLTPGGETPESLERFRREVVACANLHHPNLVAFADAGVAEGRPYLVMEYLDGKPLSSVLRERGTLPASEAAALVADLARGLAAAHEGGILHRDVKPENVILLPDGRPVLTDFGLARPSGREMERLTVTGEVLGTPGFMAPEQANGEPDQIGPATDIHALGATLYALLTGVPPFRGASLMATLLAVLETPAEPPSRHAPVPRELERICLRCLEKDPASRYQRADQVASALEALAEPAASTGPGSARLGLVIGALVLLGVGVLGGMGMTSGTSPAVRPTPTPLVSPTPTPTVDLQPGLRSAQTAEADRDLERALKLLHALPQEPREASPLWWNAVARVEFARAYRCSSREGFRLVYAAATRAIELLPSSPSPARSESHYWRAYVHAGYRPSGAPAFEKDLAEAARGDSPLALVARGDLGYQSVPERLVGPERTAAYERAISNRLQLLRRAYDLASERGWIRERIRSLLANRLRHLARFGGRRAFKLAPAREAGEIALAGSREEPKSPFGHYLLAIHEKELLQEVLLPLEKGAARDPSARKLFDALVVEVGQPEAVYRSALKNFGLAEERDPTWPAVFRERGYLHSRMVGRVATAKERAIEDLRRACELEPEFPHNHYTLSLVLNSIGQTQEAWTASGEAVARAIELPSNRWGLRVRLWLKLGSPRKETRQLLEGIRDQAPRDYVWAGEAAEALLAKDLQTPIERLRFLCGGWPQDPATWQTYSFLLESEPDSAQRTFLQDIKRALKGPPLPPRTQAMLERHVRQMERR